MRSGRAAATSAGEACGFGARSVTTNGDPIAPRAYLEDIEPDEVTLR